MLSSPSVRVMKIRKKKKKYLFLVIRIKNIIGIICWILFLTIIKTRDSSNVLQKYQRKRCFHTHKYKTHTKHLLNDT